MIEMKEYLGMKRLTIIICRLLLVTLIRGAPAVAGSPVVVTIVQDQNVKPFQQTVEAFKATLRQTRPDIEFIQAENKTALQPSSLIFTLGPSALRNSLTDLSGSPLLATMIIDSKELHGSLQASAVVLKTSVKKQLQWHRRMLPKARRVGVLYDPQYNQQWVREAKISAPKLGLEIIAVPVNTPKELSAALKELGRQADSILGITDKTVYSGRTAKAVLLFSFRNRIPFVGLSSAWVKAGALYSLDWDYPQLGRQNALIALNILDGKKTGISRVQTAEKMHYVLNLKTAKQMKMSFSQELIDGAFKVYQ